MADQTRAVLNRLRNASAAFCAMATLAVSDALAQVRPNPMGTRDAEIMSGREWAGYFIGGFLLLIVLVIIRQNQNQKRKQKQQEAKHRRHMEKMKEERRQAAAQKRPPPQ